MKSVTHKQHNEQRKLNAKWWGCFQRSIWHHVCMVRKDVNKLHVIYNALDCFFGPPPSDPVFSISPLLILFTISFEFSGLQHVK